MGWIAIDCLNPGMTLKADFVAPDGRILLPWGTVLQERHIKMGKAWGVRGAEIVGVDQGQADADKAAKIGLEFLEQSRLILGPFLRCAEDDHPAMREIIRVVVERTALELAAGKRPVFCVEVSQPIPDLHAQRSEDGELAAARLVQAQQALVSLPEVYGKIMEVLESPNSSAWHIAEVVGGDSSLCAKLLKLVNSPLYAFPSRIDSIPRAVALLGTRELSSLALGISVVSAFEGIPAAPLNMEQFWMHSISIRPGSAALPVACCTTWVGWSCSTSCPTLAPGPCIFPGARESRCLKWSRNCWALTTPRSARRSVGSGVCRSN